MKATFKFLSLLLLLIVLCSGLINISNSISIETSFLSLRVNIGFLIFFCSVLSALSLLLLLMSLNTKGKQNLKKQAENARLNYEIESDKVKQLEAKIKTLEEALKLSNRK